jgi:hypothetical protein
MPIVALIFVLIIPQTGQAQSVDDVKAMMATVNQQLSSAGENIRLEVAEFQTYQTVAQRVYFDDRTLQLENHFVPADPRRGGNTHISWLSDQTEGIANGVTQAETQQAVSDAMNTWDSIDCAVIPLVQYPDYGLDWGYIQYLTGFGGIPGWLADITNAGWLPGSFFDYIGGPGGSDYILGATFTFIWLDDDGNPSDIDNDGKIDVAFREIYYNNQFPWGIGTNNPIDVESVVVHEVGHGLSLGHFGKLFRTLPNGLLHFSPNAIMNAGYTGVDQIPSGTDLAAFCSLWGAWPQN